MFLPINKKYMIDCGWERPDFVIVSGDAYIDHPSFGVAIISRMLEKYNYKVCILPQPKMDNDEDFLQFGEPRLGFLVTSGNIDSMVNHYSVNKKRRRKDNYSPNGKMGKRPDRATIVYSKKIKKLFPDSPVIIGGIEASLRRLAHYDYWDNRIRKSILLDSNADLLIYGMAEKTIIEVADYLNSGLDVQDIIFLRGTVYKTKNKDYLLNDAIYMPSFNDISSSKKKYAEFYKIQYQNNDAINAKGLIESYKDVYVVQNKPALPLSKNEMDEVYDLKYMRYYHPIYKHLGHIPAVDEVENSIIINRGCFGNCSFCALSMHQGRTIQSRSKESVLLETNEIIKSDNYKGYINDVGGPTANFYVKSCKKQEKYGVCKTKQCLFPDPCKELIVDHSEYLDIIKEIRNNKNVKKVFIRSGIRYDYLMYDKNDTFFKELVKHHISGQLKVAPEHVSDNVLKRMGKPNRELYDKFVNKYNRFNKQYNKHQFLVPYLMSSHPGSTMKDAIELACYIRDMGYNPEQVQDFYPTPGTLSTCMYYTGIDPLNMESVYVPRTQKEKRMQRALLQYRNPKNYYLVYEALISENRYDLIGNKKSCLIKEKNNIR